MDFLDPHEKDSISKKCNRVRSWYLYEQYKSLERNQIDAACLLKSKSYQNNLLRQELKERRARRRLCDSNELCRSEFRTNKDNIRSNISVSDDNLFDSVCELHEDGELKDICSCDGSKTSKYDDNVNKEDLSCSDSVLSVVDITTNYPQDVKKELEIVKKNIAQNINLQLETVKENVECLEKFTKLNDEDLLSRGNSEVADFKDVNKNVKEKSKNSIESLLSIWSKLVLFAYNTSQSNHGNCYCHFSFQLVTAVLACDFLRRSVDKMCYYFQSYVSPIKFASSDCNTFHPTYPTKTLKCYNGNKKTKQKSLKTHKNCRYCSDGPSLKRNYNKKYHSEYKSHSKRSFSNTINGRKCRGASEPWQSFDVHETKIGGSYRLNTDSYKRLCYCHDLEIIVDRIQQVARDMEILLEDVDDTSSKYYF